MITNYSSLSQIASKIPTKSDALTNAYSYLSGQSYFENRYGAYIIVGILIILSLILIGISIMGIYDSRNSMFGTSIIVSYGLLSGIIFLIASIVMGICIQTSVFPRNIYTAYQDAYVHKAKTSQIDTPLLINNSNQLSTKLNFDNQTIVIYYQTNLIKKHPVVKITENSVSPSDEIGQQYIKLTNRAYRIADTNNIQMPVFKTDNNSNLQLSFSTNSKYYKLSFKAHKIVEVVLK